MTTKQTSVRMPEATRRQIEELMRLGWGDITKVVTVAVDRMWREELGNGNGHRPTAPGPGDGLATRPWANATE